MSAALERRIASYVADAREDWEQLTYLHVAAKKFVDQMHLLDVTLCDAGCGEDLQGVVETLKPRSWEQVRQAAEDKARDRETW